LFVNMETIINKLTQNYISIYRVYIISLIYSYYCIADGTHDMIMVISQIKYPGLNG